MHAKDIQHRNGCFLGRDRDVSRDFELLRLLGNRGDQQLMPFLYRLVLHMFGQTAFAVRMHS